LRYCARDGGADSGPPATIRIVWVDGKGKDQMVDKVKKVYAEMAAKGWKFADLDVYIENGGMQGTFVTYQRGVATAAAGQ
jgi:hypothetical protein